jgi:ubiquinone/menaquinone biosynthesis C-methylase UbiE
MSNQQTWDEFFESFYAEVYQLLPKIARADEEVDTVLNLLKPQPEAHILDWCGGWGRHSIPLAKRGYQVTLLDVTPLHIQMARNAAQTAGVSLNLVQADFRQTPPEIQADIAVNLFTSGIGFFSPEDDAVALRSLYAALKPGAKILIDTFPLARLLKSYLPKEWEELGDGKWLLEERRFDKGTGRNHNRMILLEPGKPAKEKRFDHKIYSRDELAEVITAAGFTDIHAYGGLVGEHAGSEYTEDSPRLILVANKP